MTQSTEITIPSQAQIDAAVARGRRLQSKAFVGFFSSIGAIFSTGGSHTDLALGNAPR